MSVTGILPINKPAGVRSTSCVSAVRRILGRKTKVGHGGTLDSTADGVLVLLIGAATRLSSLVMSLPKRYETTIALGASTETDDAGGEITATARWSHVTEAAIDSLLLSFCGWRLQSPPAISAVKVNGERSHKLARGGADVNIPPRPVYFASTVRTGPLDNNGRVTFSVLCSKGTYIRSFARDLGERLGTLAHVCKLTRVESGPYKLGSLKKFEELSDMNFGELTKNILPVESLLPYVNAYSHVGDIQDLKNGRPSPMTSLERRNFSESPVALGTSVITAGGVFSLCRTERCGATVKFFPVTNIFYEGANMS